MSPSFLLPISIENQVTITTTTTTILIITIISSPCDDFNRILDTRLQLNCLLQSPTWLKLWHVDQAPATADEHHDDDGEDDNHHDQKYDDDDDDYEEWWSPSTNVVLGPKSNLIVARPASTSKILLLLKPDNIFMTMMMRLTMMNMITKIRTSGLYF